MSGFNKFMQSMNWTFGCLAIELHYYSMLGRNIISHGSVVWRNDWSSKGHSLNKRQIKPFSAGRTYVETNSVM